MIILYGPAGAGKSMQGQLLAARFGWRWLSTGQLLRDTHDPKILAEMNSGKLVSHESIVRVMGKALADGADMERLVLDGFPRQIEQAKWLVESQLKRGQSIGLVIVLDVNKQELAKRLRLRGRPDDTPEAVERRHEEYQLEMRSVLDYFKEQNVPIVHVDGNGAVNEVHDRITHELEVHLLK